MVPPSSVRTRRPVVLVLLVALVLAAAVVAAVVIGHRSNRPHAGATPLPPSSATSLPTSSAPPTSPSPPSSFQLPSDTTTDVTPVPAPATATIAPAGGSVAPLPAPIGFGRRTTGGAAGAVYHVTSDADSFRDVQPGTLRYGLTRPQPLWIVLDRDMTVRFSAAIVVAPDKTIDGRGHDVLLTGHGVPGLHLYDTHNVIVENVTFRDFGDVALTKKNNKPDEIDIRRSSDLWIDHCTMSVAGDKLISVEDGAEGVTISWNHFFDQEQTLQIGAISTAPNDVKSTITIHHNFFDRDGYRLPLVAYGKVHVFNNFMFEWKTSAVRSEELAQVYLERNVLQAAASPIGAVLLPASKCGDSGVYCDARAGYLYSVDNTVIGTAFIRDSGPGHVFDPSAAYPYTAAPADQSLVEAIRSGAGVVRAR